MSITRPLTNDEVKLLETYNKLHRVYTDYMLRKAILNSSIALVDTISQSIYEIGVLNSDDLKVLSFLGGLKSNAYGRLADLPTAIRWFEILKNKTFSDLNQSLSS